VLASPVLAVIAAAIKLGSPGPVLFVQKRVGAHGRPFRLMKFRTMHDRRTAGSEWECDNRDRVTRIGAWLRAFRLDELPQLVNVLRGEMNLVGPRPHPASNLELFTLVGRNLIELTGAPVSCYALRGLVRPGLTGWAQVRYQYANNLEEEIEKLRYDLYYVKHQSLRLDARILVETIRPLVFGRVVRPATPSTTITPHRNRPTAGSTRNARPSGASLGTPHDGRQRARARDAAVWRQRPRPGRQGGGQSSNGSSTTTGAKPPVRPPDGSLTVKGADRDYFIGIDDVIEVTVWNNKDVTRTVRVRHDGKVSLPLLQDIVVAGLTPMQLQTWLTEALAGYMKQPEVSVIVHESTAARCP
jgi:lipopolysaccharide/colanic/teichoic acid biosynthesis glycosyltransferase